MTNATIQPSLASSSSTQQAGSLRLAFNIFTLLITSFGNSLVMTVILRKKDLNINDRFILNLAIADVLFILFSLPGSVFTAFKLAHYSQFVCSFIRPLNTMFFCLSLFTITSMALYRCKVMLNSYQPKMRPLYANIWIALLWLLAFFTALPAIVVAMVTTKGGCSGKWQSESHKDAYIIFLLLAKCVLPLILISFSYIRIGIFLHKNRVPAGTASEDTRAGMNYRNRVENIKVAKTVAALVLMFVVCTGPFQIAWIMTQFGGLAQRRRAIHIFRVSTILQNLHTCFNPIIYAISRKYYRQEFTKYLATMFCCCCGKLTRKVHPQGENIVCDDVTHQARYSTHAHEAAVNKDDHVTFSGLTNEMPEATERTQSFLLSPLFTRKAVASPVVETIKT